jgi:peptidoglycan/LPS O-acetylase OafA/YrhL
VSDRRQPELDGIRGLAILGVLATHSCAYLALTPGTKPLLSLMYFGQWGVDLFFALSGFLITGILLETKSATNYFRSFYARRALRIWPIYYSVLAILFSLALISPWVAANAPPRLEWGSYVFYLQNIPTFWADKLVPQAGMVGHFWSLAIEEQFYFVWPILVLFVPEDSILAICVLGFIVALPLRLYMLTVFGYSWGEMVLTTARMDGLFVGAALAVLSHQRKKLSWKFSAIPGVAGLMILGWIGVFHRTDQFIGAGPYMRTFGVTAVALLSGALIALSQLRVRSVSRFLSKRWLRFFGRYSYGIYVFHVPIFLSPSAGLAHYPGIAIPLPLKSAVLFILGINCVSIITAVASFELFESRFLRFKAKFKPRLHEGSAILNGAAAAH